MRTSSTICPSWVARSVLLVAETYVEKAKNAAVATCDRCAPSALHCPIVSAMAATSTNVIGSGPARNPSAAWTAIPVTTAAT